MKVEQYLKTVRKMSSRVIISLKHRPEGLQLNGEHIRFVLDGLRENTTRVRNIKQYLRAMLLNAPSTISNYYTALVAHDMAQPDWGKSKSGLPDGSCGGDESL